MSANPPRGSRARSAAPLVPDGDVLASAAGSSTRGAKSGPSSSAGPRSGCSNVCLQMLKSVKGSAAADVGEEPASAEERGLSPK
jgi:hypothetical protein